MFLRAYVAAGDASTLCVRQNVDRSVYKVVTYVSR